MENNIIKELELDVLKLKKYLELLDNSELIRGIKSNTEILVKEYNNNPNKSDNLIEPLLCLKHYVNCYSKRLNTDD